MVIEIIHRSQRRITNLNLNSSSHDLHKMPPGHERTHALLDNDCSLHPCTMNPALQRQLLASPKDGNKLAANDVEGVTGFAILLASSVAPPCLRQTQICERNIKVIQSSWVSGRDERYLTKPGQKPTDCIFSAACRRSNCSLCCLQTG